MTWIDRITLPAIAPRRRIVSAALVYGLSLTVRFTSPTGEEAETPAQAVQTSAPMTSIMIKDEARGFYRQWGPRSTQPIAFRHWPPGFQRSPCGL
jgi:hypothetical protein